jgi:hypothetical protein
VSIVDGLTAFLIALSSGSRNQDVGHDVSGTIGGGCGGGAERSEVGAIVETESFDFG